MRSHARVVVVGGGCVGANILLALAKNGWTDTVLLERTERSAPARARRTAGGPPCGLE